MPFLGAETLYEYARMFRIVYLKGHVGSGKTSAAFRLGGELVERGYVRYLFSNVQSVWGDNPEDMQFREQVFANGQKQLCVDAVLILDEGGLFLKHARQAERFATYLRKLNIIVLVPSVSRPSSILTTVTVQRVFNARVVGLPFWFYKMTVNDGNIKETERFVWKNPEEIWGVFDTAGMPSDASELEDYVTKWTETAQKSRGYKPKSQTSVDLSWLGQSTSNSDGVMEAIESLAQDVLEGQAETLERIPLLEPKRRKK